MKFSGAFLHVQQGSTFSPCDLGSTAFQTKKRDNVKHQPSSCPLSPIALAVTASLSTAAFAQGVATDRDLTPVVTITGARSGLDPNLPSSTFSMSAETLERAPLTNTQDVLNYAPSSVVRRLKVGDTNGGLSGRSFSVGQPQRVLAYVDGLLISNFLASHQVPRWSMVDPAEVARIDVLYGPYSAIYPGNSIGTTVAITTRTPQGFEGTATARAYSQIQDNYGYEQDFSGHQLSAYLGHRVNGLWGTLTLNQTRANVHGTGYATSPLATANTGGTAVTGAVRDRDVSGNPIWVWGNTGLTDTTQTLIKLRLGYDFSATLKADLTFARFASEATGGADTFLRDAADQPVWRGKVLVEGASYTLPLMGPRAGEDAHQQLGLRLRTRHATGWNGSIQLSDYQIKKDISLTSGSAMANSSGVVAGTLGSSVGAGDGGTGWKTAEIQATYTPDAQGHHALAFGLHQNNYKLQSRSYNLSDWHDASTRTAETANYFGNTRVQALYAQDAWQFAPDWKLTSGLRLERFEASDGSQFFAGANGNQPIVYANRRINGTSPKLSLAHAINDDWLAKLSVGRGVRFPTVAELFQGVKTGTEIVQNDPNLKAEVADSVELSFQRDVGATSLRVSLFQDNTRDAIYTQRTVSGSTVASVKKNIDKVRVQGLELAWEARSVWVRGLDLQASLTALDPKIVANAVTPTSVGKQVPGMPKLRASALASWRGGPWLASLGLRHEGRRYLTLDNSDINPATYGGSNAFTVVDAKLGYQVTTWGTVSVSATNLTNQHYYETHPYAGRVVSLDFSTRF